MPRGRKVTATPKEREYTSRMALEDAIEAYAKAYAGYCMKVAPGHLQERMYDHMMSALEVHEHTLRAANVAASAQEGL